MANKDENVHAGHKKRMREKFAAFDDFTGFEDHEILEMLLSYSNIRQNTNETAHRLLKQFGTIYGVFSAGRHELMQVDGVGEHMATLILMQRALFGVYKQSKFNIINSTTECEDLFSYLISLFEATDKEHFYMICVSKTGKMTKTHLLNRGTVDYITVEPREVVKIAINANAYGVIFAHNHPTGIEIPSNEDIETTKMLYNGLRLVNIKLIDHYLVANEKCISILSDFRSNYIKRK